VQRVLHHASYRPIRSSKLPERAVAPITTLDAAIGQVEVAFARREGVLRGHEDWA
jgi:hypothetical protein